MATYHGLHTLEVVRCDRADALTFVNVANLIRRIEDIDHKRQCSLWMVRKRDIRDIVKVTSWSRGAG
jgi:hypothetical protein